MPLPRRAVVAITSATAPLHEGNPTGLFIIEALHPFQVFKAAGFEVDFVSEKGTYVADWLSLQPSFLSGEDKEQWEDENGEFRQKVDNMPSVSSIDGKNVGPAPDRRVVTQLMYHFHSTASFSPARGMRP
jgi:putative intracellular protease/amidase